MLVSYEPASEQDLIHSFEMFLHLGEVDLELTEEEEQTAVESMLRQMEESHILRETQDYLVGVLTDNELPLESLDNRAELENMQIRTENGEEMKLEDLRRLAGVGKVEVTEIDVFPTLSAGPNALVHFKDENGKGKSGIRGTVNVTFTIKIQISESGALHISPVLALEQEFMLDPTISMKLRWDTYFGIPYVSGVYVDAALDTGTYTGIGICVTAKTVNAPPEADWDGVNNQITEHILGGGNNDSTTDLKLSIAQKLIEAGQKLEKKDDGGTGGQGNASVGAELPEKYSAMLANNATYVDMVNEPIGEFDIGLDPTQIVHIGAVVSLVVRMKINAMIGTGAYFEIAKRYSFHIVLEENGERNAYGSESDLTPAHLRVDFYAFGMVGVKLGVRLDLRLGVISTKFASVGLVAEVGAYAELYGFLYAMYDWKDGKGSWSAAGSLLFTTGLYVELSFKLQIGFDSVSWQAGIWSKKLELWHFGAAMAGFSFQKTSSNFVTGTAYVLTDTAPNYRYLDYSTNDSRMSVGGVPSWTANMSYYGRLGWSYDNRYMLQVNFRADAYDTSKLDPSNRWGYFPSVSAGWTVSNERFMAGVKDAIGLTFLKFRASWGLNGNVNAMGAYQYSDVLAANNRNGYNFTDGGGRTVGVGPSGVLPNPKIKWETSRQLDLGVDMHFFKDRLSLTIDWYNKDTDNLITSTTAPANTGSTTTYINAGMVNNHGTEIELGWKDTAGDFSYSISGNLATLHNKVTKGLQVGRTNGYQIHTAEPVTYFEEGYPLWYLRLYNVTGVDQQTGEAIYENRDDNPAINDNDRICAGKGMPDLTYGLTVNLAWKGFDFILNGTGAAGVQRLFAMTRADVTTANTLKEFYTNAWQSPSSSGYKHPKPTNDSKILCSTDRMFNADFFKIKQIQLGYTLPQKFTKKILISNLRLYASMDDWFVFTKYPGFDPETATTGSTSGKGLDKGNYPNSKKLLFGVNISF